MPASLRWSQQINGAIGYVEYAYAMENKMVYTKMVNAAGKTLDPTMDAFAAAASNADFTKVQDYLLDPHRSARRQELADHGRDLHADAERIIRPIRMSRVLKFLDWCLKNGQQQATALQYVPLPPTVVSQIEASWAQWFKGQDGKPIWTASAR